MPFHPTMMVSMMSGILEILQLYPDIEITIYNRWGQLIWQSERGYPVPWDGSSRGEELPIDSYHFVIELNNGLKPIIGDVTIVIQ